MMRIGVIVFFLLVRKFVQTIEMSISGQFIDPTYSLLSFSRVRALQEPKHQVCRNLHLSYSV